MIAARHSDHLVLLSAAHRALNRRRFGKRHALSLENNVTVKDLINEGRR